MKLKSTFLTLMLALLASAAVRPDTKPKDGDPNASRGGDRRSFNYEEFRQKMAERLKASLKVSDEEWAVLQPLIETVQTKQRDTMGSRYSSFGGSSRGPGSSGGGSSSSSNDPNRPPRAGSAERDALRTALENENASPEELKAKLAAVRQIREKSAAELAAAREDLKKVLTVRQEATLVAYGILE